MFEISVLKEMKLAELQKIAKLAKNIKSTGVKKDALIQLILEAQSTTQPEKAEETAAKIIDEKQKRARIAPEKKPVIQKKNAEIDVFSANLSLYFLTFPITSLF